VAAFGLFGSRVRCGASLIYALAATLGAVRVCTAQVEVTPYVGLYVPTPNVPSSPVPCFAILDSALDGPQSSCGPSAKQRTGPLLGVRLTGWLSQWLALDISLGYAPTSVTTQSATLGEVVTVSTRLLVAVSPRDARLCWFVAGGPAVIMWKGVPYAATPFDAVVGIGARFKAASSVMIRAEIEAYLFQNDFVFSLGVPVAVPRSWWGE
jgi:hypothetical protein